MPEKLSETYTVHDMDNNEKILNQLIELYFEGMTTLEQERQLRSMLADGRFRSREADEARAVLGVSAILRSHGTVRRRPVRMQHVAAAAVVLIASAIAGYFSGTGTPAAPQSECFAYVGTELVQDPDEVLGIMQSQLADMSAVADEVSRDLENSITLLKISEK